MANSAATNVQLMDWECVKVHPRSSSAEITTQILVWSSVPRKTANQEQSVPLHMAMQVASLLSAKMHSSAL